MNKYLKTMIIYDKDRTVLGSVRLKNNNYTSNKNILTAPAQSQKTLVFTKKH